MIRRPKLIPDSATIYFPNGQVVVVGKSAISSCCNSQIVIRSFGNGGKVEKYVVYHNLPMMFEYPPFPEKKKEG